MQNGQDCRSDKLVAAFRVFGARSRIPMLWVYAANDHFFGPDLAKEIDAAFSGAGGNATFVAAPAFGNDGHGLFSPAGISLWTPYVDAFLQKQNLKLRETSLPLPVPDLVAPPRLGVSGRNALATYAIDAPHKAFAVAPDGAFGWKSGARTTEKARAEALKFCQQHAPHCDIIFVDDAAAGH
jgi:hypothetical protein